MMLTLQSACVVSIFRRLCPAQGEWRRSRAAPQPSRALLITPASCCRTMHGRSCNPTCGLRGVEMPLPSLKPPERQSVARACFIGMSKQVKTSCTHAAPSFLGRQLARCRSICELRHTPTPPAPPSAVRCAARTLSTCSAQWSGVPGRRRPVKLTTSFVQSCAVHQWT